MNKLLRSLHPVRVKDNVSKYISTNYSVSHDPTKYESTYILEATFRKVVIARPDLIGEAALAAKKALVEDIFGEFREQIVKIYEYLSLNDTRGAIKHLKKLEEMLFSVEELEL